MPTEHFKERVKWPPSNLAAIQLMKEYMAGEIGVDDGEIIAMSKGVHLYEYAWDLARATARVK